MQNQFNKVNNLKLELGFMRHNLNDFNETQKIVDFAMEHNQHYFETCYFYLDYNCETFIYKALKKYDRNAYELCGKMPVHNILEHSTAEQIFEEQLEKVPGHYFDIYLLQALDSHCFSILQKKKAISYLLEQKRLGRIKRLGISIQCTPETFKKYLDLKCWDIVQMPLNYFDWFVCRGNELYELAIKYNLPIIAQAPMKGGLLANHINVENPTKFAFDFIKQLDNIEYVLSGCSKLESYKNSYINLFDKITKTNFNLYKLKLQEYLDTMKISCINCNLCYLECQKNIPIPAIINLYNNCINLDNLNHIAYFNSLNILKKCINEPVNECTRCNKCIDKCPAKINIVQTFYNIFEIRT